MCVFPLTAQGLGAPSAPAHKDLQNPLDAPVAGDSGVAPSVGITEINNKSSNKSGESGSQCAASRAMSCS